MIPTGKLSTLVDHGHRGIHRVDTIDPWRYGARDKAGPTAEVEDCARLVADQVDENLECAGRILRAVPVRGGYGPVFKSCGDVRPEEAGRLGRWHD